MSLFARIAWTGAALLGVVALIALLVWRPYSRETFVRRTEGLLASAEGDFRAIAASLVDRTMDFATAAALDATEQRALAIEDLPVELLVDRRGRLVPERLKTTLRDALADPGTTGGEKHAAVRAEILARARSEVGVRLAHLRTLRAQAAVRHGDRVAWRTLLAWCGLVLLLLGGWAIALERVVVRPVRDATDAVSRFGEGERKVRLAPRGAAELVRLANAFNATAVAVEEAEAENAALRTNLEEKVKERTAALVRAARASTAGTMAGGVAHEFNNLLGGILGCAAAGLEEDPKPEVAEVLGMIRKTASRGVGVTRALLRATRAEPELESCRLEAIFEEALAEVRPPAGVEVIRDFEAGLTLRADAAMLRQVLANLMRNAVTAMAGSGRLALRARAAGEEVILSVGDSGPGVDPSVGEILFEPFVTTRQGGREGTGLGLFLAERLVAAHAGRIAWSSETGRGTRFEVRLPVSARDS